MMTTVASLLVLAAVAAACAPALRAAWRRGAQARDELARRQAASRNR